MDAELLPLVRELCYIAATRNALNKKRNSGRQRKHYYRHAIELVEAHRGSNREMRSLDPERHAKRIESIKEQMAWMRNNYPYPKKWMKIGLRQLRLLALKATADVSNARYEMAQLSNNTAKRLKEIRKVLNFRMQYSNGYVQCIVFTQDDHYIFPHEPDFKKYAEEYVLQKATDEFLKG